MGGYTKPVASGAAAAVRMDALLNDTFVALPKVKVLLASLIGSTRKYGGDRHAEYNALLPSLVKLHAARGFAIEFVDMAIESGIGSKCDRAYLL
jgi:hypothetical protein